MKRLRLILILPAAVVLAGLALILIQPAEPRYKGRTLTSYLRGPWKQIDGPQTENPHFAPDLEAIRAIGTNGIPTLLRLIQAHDPPWKAKAIALLNNQKLVHMDLLDARRKRELGQLGFMLLGDLAAPATAELVKLLQNGDPKIRSLVGDLLLQLQVGPRAHLAALSFVVKDDQVSAQISAIIFVFASKFPDEAQTEPFRKLIDDWQQTHGFLLTKTNAPAAK